MKMLRLLSIEHFYSDLLVLKVGVTQDPQNSKTAVLKNRNTKKPQYSESVVIKNRSS